MERFLVHSGLQKRKGFECEGKAQYTESEGLCRADTAKRDLAEGEKEERGNASDAL